MRRLWWVLVLVVVLGLILGPGLAYADIRWCESDPVVKVGDTVVSIVVSLPEEAKPLVRGPVHVAVHVPRGVEASVLWTDAGFNGQGEKVVLIPDGRAGVISVGVLVFTAGGRRFPVSVAVSTSTGGSATQLGETNRIVTLEGIPLS